MGTPTRIRSERRRTERNRRAHRPHKRHEDMEEGVRTDAHLRYKSVPLVLREQMSDRATCWSITINNPTENEMAPTLPAKWALTGQVEKGEEGTEHYQGMLKTPQERFSAIKKVFPRAHIEVARNRKALEQYVHKSDSRIAERPDVVSNIPTLFDYQHTVARNWDDDEYKAKCEKYFKGIDGEESFMQYLDDLVIRDIEDGVCGVEFIAINPMWRSAWKKFGRAMIKRERRPPAVDIPSDSENEVVERISPLVL